ncbi:MAG: hypothetical protein WAM73_10725 [Desulfobacterales bacterium]
MIVGYLLENGGLTTDHAIWQKAGPREVSKVASGNIAVAAASVGKNKVGDSVSSVRDKERVKMKRNSGEWKVVVTDKLYDVLTGKGK